VRANHAPHAHSFALDCVSLLALKDNIADPVGHEVAAFSAPRSFSRSMVFTFYLNAAVVSVLNSRLFRATSGSAPFTVSGR
jgi:hypothetical protein